MLIEEELEKAEGRQEEEERQKYIVLFSQDMPATT